MYRNVLENGMLSMSDEILTRCLIPVAFSPICVDSRNEITSNIVTDRTIQSGSTAKFNDRHIWRSSRNKSTVENQIN